MSVALSCDGRLLTRSERLANGGSDRLLPWVRELLDEAGLSLQQLDGVAFGAGPGGFTGIRLACGVAQGLAFGADLPVVGICGLEAMAALAAESGAQRVYACLDARMNEVYTAAYEMRGGVPVALQSPAVTPPDLALVPPGEGWVGAGDGFAAYPDLSARLALASVLPDCLPTAVAIARLAAPCFARGEGVPADQAQPLYVRDKVALTTAERLARGGVR